MALRVRISTASRRISFFFLGTPCTAPLAFRVRLIGIARTDDRHSMYKILAFRVLLNRKQEMQEDRSLSSDS